MLCRSRIGEPAGGLEKQVSVSTTGPKHRLVRGVIAPLYTPLRKDLSIDDDGIRSLVGYLARTHAVNAVFARSGIGQIYSFTVAEAKRFGVRTRDAIGGRMALMLGCPGEWLERGEGARPDPDRYVAQGVELTRYAARIGVDVAVHPIPAALLPRGDEPVAEMMFRYYRTMNDVSSIPILIYQPPGTPHEYYLTPELLKRLTTLPKIVGAKISSQRDSVMQPLLAAAQGTRFGVICGNEGYLLRGLQQGATGVIGIGTMVIPEVHRAIVKRYWAHDVAGASRANDDLARALNLIDRMNPKIASKQYLHRKGVRITTTTREDPDMYSDSGSKPYSAEVVDGVEKLFDELRRKYRVA